MFHVGAARRCLRAALLVAVLFTASSILPAQVWERIETDSHGQVVNAYGSDAQGRLLRLVYSASEEDGALHVTAVFLRDDETLGIGSVIDGAEDRVTFHSGGGTITAVRSGKGGAGEGTLRVRFADGEESRIGLGLARYVLTEAPAVAARLAETDPVTGMLRAFLAAEASLPAPAPPHAGLLLRPLVVDGVDPGALPDRVGLPLFGCYKECVDGCPDQCAYICGAGWPYNYPLCDTCVASCALGCGIGCGCFTCDATPLPQWEDLGHRF